MHVASHDLFNTKLRTCLDTGEGSAMHIASEMVSIIIPTYKRADRLDEAIQSVLNQTYHNIEIIVVDDNDPDTVYRKDTTSKMDKYSSNDRIKYVCHEHNMNGAAARNTGIKESSGAYISFLDDDDLYYPLKIEKEVEFLDSHREFDACYCWRKQNGQEICGCYKGDLSKEILLEEFSPTTPALMFRRNSIISIGCFNPSYRRHQDYELLLKFFKQYKIGYVSNVLVEIGNNDGANELHGKELERNKEQFLEDFREQIQSIDGGKYKRKIPAYHYLLISIDHITHGKIIMGIKYYFKSFFLSPIFVLTKFTERLNAWLKFQRSKQK